MQTSTKLVCLTHGRAMLTNDCPGSSMMLGGSPLILTLNMFVGCKIRQSKVIGLSRLHALLQLYTEMVERSFSQGINPRLFGGQCRPRESGKVPSTETFPLPKF